MDAAIEQALRTERTIDITTTGRNSGQPRRIEIWYHHVDGRYYITGSPGSRDWYANLLAEPSFTFHLKGAVKADLPASARPITAPAKKEAVFRSLPWTSSELSGDKVAEWVAGAPLVEVEFQPS